MKGSIVGQVAGLALLLSTATAIGQDAVSVGPNVYRKVLENPRVRVLAAEFKPGAKIGTHSHPDHLLYMLSDGILIIKPVGRTPYEMTFTAGQALWLLGQSRAAENDGDKPVKALVVEMKPPPPVIRKARGKRAVAKVVRKRR